MSVLCRFRLSVTRFILNVAYVSNHWQLMRAQPARSFAARNAESIWSCLDREP